MRRIKSSFIPFSLFSLAFIIRFAFISKGPFHADILELIIAAQKTLETLRLHYVHLPGFPLTVIMAAVQIAIFRIFSINDPVFAVNFMAAFFGSLCVVMLYFLAKELFDDFTGIFSAALLMVLPPFLAASTYGKDHAAAILFALTGIYLLLKYLASRRTALLIFSGISLGLCGSMRIADSLIAGVVFLFLIMKTAGGKNNLKTYTHFTLAMALPLLIFYIPLFIRIKSGEIPVYTNFLGTAHFMGLASPLLHGATGYLLRGLSGPGAILSFFGLYLVFLKDKKISFFFLIWFLTLFLYYGNISTLEPRYLIISFIPLVMSMGYFFSRLTGLNSMVRICSWALFFVIFIHLFSGILPLIDFNHRYNLQADFARWVRENTEENALVLAMDESPFIEYYAKRKTLNYPVVPITCDEKVVTDFILKHISNNLMRGIPVYAITAGLAYDRIYCGTISRFLRRDFLLEPLGCRVNEDWHRGDLLLFKDCLYQIKERRP